MPFERGDIVHVYFDLPRQRETKTHPAIIISNQDVYDCDDIYICVMITNIDGKDKFSFPIEKSMLENPSKIVTGQARCHLVSYVMEKCIDSVYAVNRLKSNSVNRLVEFINNVAICED